MRCLRLSSVVPVFSVFTGESEWPINAAEQAQLAKPNIIWKKICNLRQVLESTAFYWNTMHLLIRMHCATRRSETTEVTDSLKHGFLNEKGNCVILLSYFASCMNFGFVPFVSFCKIFVNPSRLQVAHFSSSSKTVILTSELRISRSY